MKYLEKMKEWTEYDLVIKCRLRSGEGDHKVERALTKSQKDQLSIILQKKVEVYGHTYFSNDRISQTMTDVKVTNISITEKPTDSQVTESISER